MSKLIECVPNFSEGRDKTKINKIVNSIKSTPGITVLDVDSGRDTNRTVVTMVGSPNSVLEAAFNGVKCASQVLDMRTQTGTHPRLGATDVCPLIPISEVSIDECIKLTKELGKRIADELKIPIYLYEKSANKPERIKLPNIRKGEYEGLSDKLSDPLWKPDFGPIKLNAKAGATVLGCREFLIAYNINLNSKDHRIATDIAFELREAGRSKRIQNPKSKNLLDGEIVRHPNGKPVKVSGLFKNVKAIGWYVEEYKRAQISVNFNNYKESTIHDVFDQANILASKRGVRITGSELVGLIPLDAILSAGKHYLKKQNRSFGVPDKDIVECAIQSLGLNDVSDFEPKNKIIDYAIAEKNESLTDSKFLMELSRNSPAPGGGSVSALAGSLGASLLSMVAALTHEKKEMFEKKPLMDEIGQKAQILLKRLIFLIDEDTKAFNDVLYANRISVKSEKEKGIKKLAIENANKYAIQIPLETAELCLEVIKLSDQLIDNGNKNSVTDSSVAAEVGLAGLRGACMNVLINIKEVEDKNFAKEKTNLVYHLIKTGELLRKTVFYKTLKIIKK